jgi:hypothetical protein
MAYQRRVVKRRPASLTEQEWLEMTTRPPVWPPLSDVGSPAARPGPVDFDVLCWWCRCRHRASEVDQCMALPRKSAAAGPSPSFTSRLLVAGLLTPFCETWAFLTATTHPDGASRVTGRLSLSCESGQLKLSCTDDETGQYASLTGPSLDDLLLTFETGLEAGTVPWRMSKFTPGSNRKK